MSVRVRFAPSPTGYLHVGGLRTALYNYLFAKNKGGKCILRLEDTDRSRFVEDAADKLMESLEWAGIEFDESPFQGGEYGPYMQSERLDIYRKYVDELIGNGFAYYAFDSAEELTEMREKLKEVKAAFKYDRMNMRNQLTLGNEKTNELIKSGEDYVVRLKVPDEEVAFNDIIRGSIRVHGRDIDDQVLLKSDGFPTYHLANVVDDHLMKITHVIRGEEWVSSTPKHIILYNCFGWEIPVFAHLPLLLNEKKQKLSKRHGDVAVEDFRAKGYLRDAFVNFIALLGWNPTADRDIFTIDELIESFNLEKVNKGGAVFDLKKFDWIQGQYIRKQPPDILIGDLKKVLEKNNLTGFDDEYLKNCITLFLERINFVKELPENAPYLFSDDLDFEEKYLQKYWTEDKPAIMTKLIEEYKTLDDFSHEPAHDLTKSFIESNGLKFKDVIHPLRLMITGRSVGAGMFETMEVIGKEKCIERMTKFIERFTF